MAIITVYDTETTGLDTSKDYILEIGALKYDTKRKQIVEVFSDFLFWPDSPPIPQDATDVHGLDDILIMERGKQPTDVINRMLAMMKDADFVCGHNSIKYDNKIFESNMLRSIGIEKVLQENFYNFKHIDTLTDVPYPKHIKVRVLKYLALEHGYVLSNAHRAIFDCFACSHILTHPTYDFNQIVEIASTPFVTVEAKVSFENKDDAKVKGFYWNPTKKKWLKETRQYFIDAMRTQLTFDLEILPNETDSRENDQLQYQARHPQLSLSL